MPISLDTLLFWSGLALLAIGLFVFLTGKKASEESKRESNRFEAFGIKIDVNNPSLILIMLGVVMMLAPKFIPQEHLQTASDRPEDAASPDIAETLTSPPPQQPGLMPEEPASASRPPPEPPLPEARVQPIPPASHQSAPAEVETLASSPPVTPSPPATPSPKAQPASTSTADKAPAAKASTTPTAAKPPKPAPSVKPVEPVAKQPAEPSQPDRLVIAVVADVSTRAGIDDSAEAYARQAAGEIEQRAGDIFSDGVRIEQHGVADLRDHLEKGAEDYQGLCQTWQADLLILGDFRIVTGWSSIDSAYWPDYHLHLYNCKTRRARAEVFKHLNPSNRDSFPFQEAIHEKTMKFLADTRWLVEG